MVSLKRLPAEAKDTAAFIAKINRLFDVLNSRSAKDSNPWRRPLGTGSQKKENFLVDCISWVAGWQFRSGRTPPCQNGMRLSIKSILLVHKRCTDAGMKYVCTAKLNQDCIENLFSLVRGKGGHKYNPSAREFTAALRGLSQLTLVTTSLALPPPTIEPMDVQLVADIVEDKTVGDCIQEEGLFYVAGWVVRILQQEETVRVCPHCKVLLLGPTHKNHSYASSEDHPFLAAKKYTLAANLMRPSEEFFVCIQSLEEEFTRNIDTFWPHTNITNNLEMTLGRLGAFNSLLSTHPEHASLLESISIKKSVMCRLGNKSEEQGFELQRKENSS
ncbi:hypothetical protein PFLUV_G00119740 [Perca fluviatilis]|uniref:Transposable element P transposase-like RNase H C-terminal domain-containing protein n=1 Tax=Perca fluviatilis TaxID=8168 RepID=A0A6A5ETS9_PERFL|nr:hypothetical protein PFLUV_G00119740 [Perca fluviatilis]